MAKYLHLMGQHRLLTKDAAIKIHVQKINL